MFEEMKVYDHLQFTFMTPAPARRMSMSLASQLNRWDANSENECKIDDIIYKPFSQKKFEREKI